MCGFYNLHGTTSNEGLHAELSSHYLQVWDWWRPIGYINVLTPAKTNQRLSQLIDQLCFLYALLLSSLLYSWWLLRLFVDLIMHKSLWWIVISPFVGDQSVVVVPFQSPLNAILAGKLLWCFPIVKPHNSEGLNEASWFTIHAVFTHTNREYFLFVWSLLGKLGYDDQQSWQISANISCSWQFLANIKRDILFHCRLSSPTRMIILMIVYQYCSWSQPLFQLSH